MGFSARGAGASKNASWPLVCFILDGTNSTGNAMKESGVNQTQGDNGMTNSVRLTMANFECRCEPIPSLANQLTQLRPGRMKMAVLSALMLSGKKQSPPQSNSPLHQATRRGTCMMPGTRPYLLTHTDNLPVPTISSRRLQELRVDSTISSATATRPVFGPMIYLREYCGQGVL